MCTGLKIAWSVAVYQFLIYLVKEKFYVFELWFLFSGGKSYELGLIDIVCAVVLDMFDQI